MPIPAKILPEKSTIARTVTEFYTAIPGPILGAGQGTQIAPMVTDCRIIEANDAAAELMGFPSKESLNGVCLSMVRDEQQSLNSRILLMAARTKKFKRCNDELMQCFYRPGTREKVWCQKSVITLNLPHGTVWVTELKVSSQAGETPKYAPEDFGLTLGEIIRVCGTHTVAQAQDMFRHNSPLTTLDAIHTILPEKMKAYNLKNCNGVAVEHKSGDGVRYVYICSKCGYLWVSSKESPKQCANRSGCASESWRETMIA